LDNITDIFPEIVEQSPNVLDRTTPNKIIEDPTISDQPDFIKIT
jgi:hypothetical protein